MKDQKGVDFRKNPLKRTMDLRACPAVPGGARRSPAEPGGAGQGAAMRWLNHHPHHAQVFRRAGRLPQGQTPSNYYYYYYYYYYQQFHAAVVG